MKTEKEFTISALKLYPELAEDFELHKGLMHKHMSEFEIKVRNSIKSKEKDKVIKAFTIAEDLYINGDKEMKNAVDVSFAEGVLASLSDAEREWGWNLMPKTIQKLHMEFWNQFQR